MVKYIAYYFNYPCLQLQITRCLSCHLPAMEKDTEKAFQLADRAAKY